MNRCWYKLPLCLMSCKLTARLASLNNFTRWGGGGGGGAGGDRCSRSVRIFKLWKSRIARIKERRIKWEVCELIRNVNISGDKWTGGHVLQSSPQLTVISLGAQNESVRAVWFIGCSPRRRRVVVTHSYISYMGLVLWKTSTPSADNVAVWHFSKDRMWDISKSPDFLWL